MNAAEGEARLGGELPPRVGLVARGRGEPEIVVAYGAKTQATEIRVARSTDGGRTFAASRALQAAGAGGDRGWHAMALDARGAAHVMWLDHRGLAARAPGHHTETAKPGGGPDSRHMEQAAIDGVAMAERSPSSPRAMAGSASARRRGSASTTGISPGVRTMARP